MFVPQRPGSAKYAIFITLEDETGVADLLVWRKVFERLRLTMLWEMISVPVAFSMRAKSLISGRADSPTFRRLPS